MEREIVVAERDGEVRRKVSQALEQAGYRVETSESAVHAFCTILEKNVPVVLLSGDFDPKYPLPDLVRLLRKCNRKLSIILVSDEPPLPVMRSIRREGIFYHALNPRSAEETDEIRQAVDCALHRTKVKQLPGKEERK